MAQDSRVPQALIQNLWDTKLQKEVESEDIYDNYRGEIKSDGSLPNAIIVVKKATGVTTAVMGLVQALSGAGVTGRTAVSGTEEELSILDYTLFANEFKHAVKADAFGIDAVANHPYGILGLIGPMLNEYMEKNKGTHRRQAVNQLVSSNTTVAPSSTTQGINANFYVGGVAIASQPAYSDVLSTYSTSINDAIPDSGSVAAANQMTPANLKELEFWVRSIKKIRPLDDGKWVLTIPANQKRILMDEDTGILKHFSSSNQPEMALKGWFGTYGNFHLVEDLRSSMLTATNGSSSTLTWTYTTVNDSRPAVSTLNWDVAHVLGKGAIAELEIERPHFEKDLTQEYGRESRLAAFSNYGCSAVEYQLGTDDVLNQGSAVVLFISSLV